MLVFKNLKTSIKGIEDHLLNPNDLSSKLIELADRSRQNNLRIEGIEETTKLVKIAYQNTRIN